MARIHKATLSPSKPDLIAAWAPNQDWCPADVELSVEGAFRFDDPEGDVGIETHLVRAGDELLQIPLTYRAAPLDGAESAMVGTLEHSALGTRWVYDGVHDAPAMTMLAAAAMTGQGQAVAVGHADHRWFVAPTAVRLDGGGWTLERVPIDGFEVISDADGLATLRNDGFELLVHRRLAAGDRPPIGLRATWSGQTDPVVLDEVRERAS